MASGQADREVAARTAELRATIQQLRSELEQCQRAEATLRFLAEANSLIAPSLDYDSTLQSVAHLAVPFLCDYCIIDLLAADAEPRCVEVAHHDPAKENLLRHVWRRYHIAADGPPSLATVVRTRQPLLVASVPEPS